MAQDPEHAWRPSGIVSLTTDFGTDDPYVGMMHAVILSVARTLTVVDLTHGVAPQDIRAAGFFIERSANYFPRGTVHVAVVDPGVGSDRRILVVRADDQLFLAPDNGLLTEVLERADDVRALDVQRFALAQQSRTFHGRDVFAPAAARLAGGLDPLRAGPACADPLRFEVARATRRGVDQVAARLFIADRFGNWITDARVEDLNGAGPCWEARLGELTMRVLGTYAEARAGELFALVDSYGRLEIAVNGGSARERLGLDAGAEVVFHRR